MAVPNPIPLKIPQITWTADLTAPTADSTSWTADGAVLDLGPQGGGNFILNTKAPGHYHPQATTISTNV